MAFQAGSDNKRNGKKKGPIKDAQDLLELVNSKSVEAVKWGAQLNHDSCHGENSGISKTKSTTLYRNLRGSLIGYFEFGKGSKSSFQREQKKTQAHTEKEAKGRKGKKSCKELLFSAGLSKCQSIRSLVAGVPRYFTTHNQDVLRTPASSLNGLHLV